MGKMLLGLAAGVALTAAAFLVFLSDRASPPSESKGGTQSGLLIERSGVATEDGPDVASDAPRNVGNSSNRLAPSEYSELTENQLRSLTPEDLASATGSNDPSVRIRALGEEIRRETVERWGDEPPPTQPIALPSEFSWLSITETPNSSHEQLQRESVDPAWSAATEAQIAQYLAAHPEFTEKYGYPTVNCRSTGCELAFVAYGVSENMFQVMLNDGFKSIDDEPWADQFHSRNGFMDVRQVGDATTVLWHLWQRSD